MLKLTPDLIRTQVADSPVIFERGVALYENGAYVPKEVNPELRQFTYLVDGSYGDYTIRLKLHEDGIETTCDCPYPGVGCKHTVAALLDAAHLVERWQRAREVNLPPPSPTGEEAMTPEEVRQMAVEDRQRRAKSETFTVTRGDMFKGDHLVATAQGRQYRVTLQDPARGVGHCSCPDYLTNRLGTCKHIIHLAAVLRQESGFSKKVGRERFPFVDLYWDSETDGPRLFYETGRSAPAFDPALTGACFDAGGRFTGGRLADLVPVLDRLEGIKAVRIREAVLARVGAEMDRDQIAALAAGQTVAPPALKMRLYPYQEEGVRFALFKESALIGDEMGLGKTLQAIAAAIQKKAVFGFAKVLVITMASLKEQWKREIERFCDEKALVVAGAARQRREQYRNDPSYFKITNYEAVLRDVAALTRFKPDLIILDEAQRIKNFSTKTAMAVKSLPRRHAMVLTGTPLENRLEDVYSIVQFLEPRRLAPLWQFAADHYLLSREHRGKILGYRNLGRLHERLQPLVIRRRKEEVLSDLPDETVNTYYVEMHALQAEMHAGYAQSLGPLLNKPYLTPMDLRRLRELLMLMRRVCDSTYLVDRNTNISPKMRELEGILDEVVVQNGRKAVIFSEWTTMNYLIARHLSSAAIAFVELSGQVPVEKRQALIDEFSNNPDCKVFLSTDAGGTGLNLQAADCVINFELPWNPAKVRQRIGRVNRIGQKSRCVSVINLVAKGSIEERILVGLQLKTDLFEGVFDGTHDAVDLNQSAREELLEKLRQMMAVDISETAETAAGEMFSDSGMAAGEAGDETDGTLDVSGEEVFAQVEAGSRSDGVETSATRAAAPDGTAAANGAGVAPVGGAHPLEPADAAQLLGQQSPERVEAVLNSGLAFIGGLLEMATGSKLGEQKPTVQINRETGELTLKMKLPGF